jgi:hypothetical protein
MLRRSGSPPKSAIAGALIGIGIGLATGIGAEADAPCGAAAFDFLRKNMATPTHDSSEQYGYLVPDYGCRGVNWQGGGVPQRKVLLTARPLNPAGIFDDSEDGF